MTGVLFSCAALVSWGLGDFLIQRSARKFGDWTALFFVTAFGAIALLPFAYRDIAAFVASGSAILWGASIAILIAGLLDFEALRVGKISVIEPIYALEIPVAALFASFFIGEHLTVEQWWFIAALVVGLIFVATHSFKGIGRSKFEKGVWYAIFATLGMGAVNFLFGVASRETNPLVVNWFTSTFIAVAALAYLAVTGRAGGLWRDFRSNPQLVLNVGFFDNLAWITFSYATLFVPVAIATGISEGYIAFASMLGIAFNHEKLRPHQWAGLVLAVVAVIALAGTAA